MPHPLHRLNQLGKTIANSIGSKARNKGEPSGFVLGVEMIDKRTQLRRRHIWPHFKPYWILDAPHVLHVRFFRRIGSFSNPRKVRAQIVRPFFVGYRTREGLFVRKQQRFVARVESNALHGIEGIRSHRIYKMDGGT